MDSKSLLINLILTLVIFSFSLLHSEASSSILPSSESLSVSSNRSLASFGEVFEFGFFTLVPNSNKWFIGIWYKQIPVRSYVWVGNRNKPVTSFNTSLQIIDGELLLRRQSDNYTFWSSSQSESQSPPRESLVIAELLDTGNLVLRDSKNKDPKFYFWQSFHSPTDTLLPQMELGLDPKRHTDKFLSSWKNRHDPASGTFKFILNTQGYPELSVILKTADVTATLYSSGPWDGIKFAGVPDLLNLTWNKEDNVVVFSPTYSYLYTRLEMAVEGPVILHAWNENTSSWEKLWVSMVSECDLNDFCGSNAFCGTNVAVCNCIAGFERKNTSEIHEYDCVRKTDFSCHSDHFDKLSHMNFPSEPTQYNSIREIKECKKTCVADCSCSAFSVRGTCFIWRHELRNLNRQNSSQGGHEIYIKNGKYMKQNGGKRGWIVAISITAAVLLSLVVFSFWKRKRKRARASIEMEAIIPVELEATGAEMMDNRQLPPMDFGAIQKATNNFSTEIGHGGCGDVFRGRLLSGQEIAVKKLKKMSSQTNTEQFYTELRVIASMQHVNVVRLLGWCVHRQDKLLVYEYMENGSLEHHLFDGAKSCELKWQKRFDIIIGVSRGLHYLQNDSRIKIIHRDLKPANGLLDKDMIPKISDFGFARASVRSENEVMTTHMPGTYGYMSPEYAEDGIYSSKSDIYSFGVTVIEIVTGKRNRTFTYSGSTTNLVSYVWLKWNEGNWKEIVDQEMILDSSSPSSEILRCIQLALLCVQQNAADRPNMHVVVGRLENQSLEIPRPKPPGFFMHKDIPSSSSSTTNGKVSTSTYTINQLSASDLLVTGR